MLRPGGNKTQFTLYQLHKGLNPLKEGGWAGRGAARFYTEMDVLLPAVRRLELALKEAARTTLQISRIMKQAETDAARQFATSEAPSASVAPTPTQTPPTPSAPTSYTIQPGDTLWAIAIAHGLTVDQLKANNGLTSDLIVAGQALNIPPTDYVPAPASAAPGMPTQDTNVTPSLDTIPPAPPPNDYGAVPALDFSRVRYERGISEGHNGIDISNPSSTGDIAIYASYKGSIAFYWDGEFTNADDDVTSLEDNYGWGNSMIVEYKYNDQPSAVQSKWQELYGVKSGQSLYVLYAHLAAGFDTGLPGDLQAGPGDPLGWLGNTGNSSGEHLHLGVKVGKSGAVSAKQNDEGYWEIKGEWYNWEFKDPTGLGLLPSQETDGYEE